MVSLPPHLVGYAGEHLPLLVAEPAEAPQADQEGVFPLGDEVGALQAFPDDIGCQVALPLWRRRNAEDLMPRHAGRTHHGVGLAARSGDLTIAKAEPSMPQTTASLTRSRGLLLLPGYVI